MARYLRLALSPRLAARLNVKSAIVNVNENNAYMSNSPTNKDTNENHISLFFLNFDYSPEIITRQIRLSPTMTALKGETYYLGRDQEISNIRKSSFWEYQLKRTTNHFIGDSVEEFVNDIIYPRAATIRSIAETCDAELKIVQYYYNGYNPGYHFSAKIIEMLAGTGLDIDIDTYCLSSE